MVDNFEYLANLFDGLVDKDDFYFVQIIQRKKDGVELPSYTSGARTIRSFYFFTKEEFLRQESYIKDLCNSNNARAYFWINPRNTLDIACESIKQFADLIKNGNTRQAQLYMTGLLVPVEVLIIKSCGLLIQILKTANIGIG